ncbi:MAG: metallophosphoesterase family protein [Akkermansiaceae bacterium]
MSPEISSTAPVVPAPLDPWAPRAPDPLARRGFLKLTLAAAAAAAAPSTLFSRTGENPVIPEAGAIEHHRVLWMQNPATEAVISWTTRFEGANHRVHYDTVPRQGKPGNYENNSDSFKNGQFTLVAEDEKWVKPGFFHHVHLTGLKPGTTYYLVMVSDDQVSQEFHFVTALDDDRPFSMLFGGDSRIDGDDPYAHNDRRKMNLRMSALLEADPTILALVHGGDYCQRAEWRYMDAWLSDHELCTSKTGRLLPIIPTRGNHDMGVGFTEAFPWPTGLEHYYYSLPLSKRVALMILNTEISLSGDQRLWLNSELARLRADNRWVFASYHQPAFPSVRAVQDGASRREHWVPLFEKYNLDLACESHDHALKRTLKIRDGKPDPENGIVYIGDGGLGVPQRKPDPSRWWFADDGFTKPVHHVHLFQIGKEDFHVRAFGMDGSTLDDFRLWPRAGHEG